MHTHCNGTVVPQEDIAGFQVPVVDREREQGGVGSHHMGVGEVCSHSAGCAHGHVRRGGTELACGSSASGAHSEEPQPFDLSTFSEPGGVGRWGW